MRGARPGLPAVAVLSGLLLAACGGAPSDEHVIDEPALIEPIEGSEVARIMLTERAAERLDIQTAVVEPAASGTVVPTAAVMVDPSGVFWVYTSPEPLVFVRHEITIDREEGDRAFLLAGPPPGSQVVIVGVAELYGAEYGIGK